MTVIVDKKNKQQVIDANISNRILYINSLRDTKMDLLKEENGVQWVFSCFQNVLMQNFNAKNSKIVLETIEQVKKRLDGKIGALCCLVNDQSQPSDLKENLLLNGFVLADNLYGMSLELEKRNIVVQETPEHFVVKKVNNEPDLNDWVKVVCETFHIQSYEKPFTDANLSTMDLFHHYVGYEKGVPVAAISALFAYGVVGIYWVATVESARGKGYAPQLLEVVHQHALEEGYKIATLQSSEMAKHLYEKFGYEHEFTESSIEWYKG
ncbi:GNAT family N-acetyltransferase [Bacillus suaedaesalsae]|uniref:GNAT family N-acetyltransferase n=1 Tax=Bacillus suaedaesalsae TaxID=2810349 RepID=A0ABS2DEV3_9BACI|nr:GNAT family N-acetyltransferase [Bacillus suaedaesalsae]MBM6616545.1 GNAT family N-acetyltransferase [Bacillus suaedaesalsae]